VAPERERTVSRAQGPRSIGLAARAREHEVEVVLLAATAVLLAFYYFARADVVGSRHPTGAWWAVSGPPLPSALHYPVSALLLGVAPILLARKVGGLSPARLGLGLGRWREGLVWLAVGVVLAAVSGRFAAGSPAMRAVYPLAPHLVRTAGGFVPHALRSFLYYGAWELFFRGFVLFGLRGRLGDGPANAIQTALSVLAHFGRPLPETLSALPAGLLFGWIDLRVRSVWYIAVVHWTAGVAVDWFLLAH
jgi:membrane protease YdiL (CAAX protease family)